MKFEARTSKWAPWILSPAGALASDVAQICNLLYLRFAIGNRRSSNPFAKLSCSEHIQNLRYSRFKICAKPRCETGFTLAEVLAALLFMAIVLPVAIEGLHIASLGGAVAATKGEAARIAEQVLNENLVTTNWSQTLQGTTTDGSRTFRWTLNSEPWTQDPSQSVMRQLSVEVTYNVRGRDYQVKLATLVDSSLSLGLSGTAAH